MPPHTNPPSRTTLHLDNPPSRSTSSYPHLSPSPTTPQRGHGIGRWEARLGVLSIPDSLVGLVKPHVKGAAVEHSAVQGADAVGAFFRGKISDDAVR